MKAEVIRFRFENKEFVRGLKEIGDINLFESRLSLRAWGQRFKVAFPNW